MKKDLAQTGQFEDARLINYLEHLRRIWSEKSEYARFVASVHCLNDTCGYVVLM